MACWKVFKLIHGWNWVRFTGIYCDLLWFSMICYGFSRGLPWWFTTVNDGLWWFTLLSILHDAAIILLIFRATLPKIWSHFYLDNQPLTLENWSELPDDFVSKVVIQKWPRDGLWIFPRPARWNIGTWRRQRWSLLLNLLRLFLSKSWFGFLFQMVDPISSSIPSGKLT